MLKEVKKFDKSGEDGIKSGLYYMQMYSYIWFLKNDNLYEEKLLKK